MPRIGFSQQFKSRNPYDIDVFELDINEVARICCIDTEFVYMICHWLNVPNDKSSMGNYACMGDPNVVLERGKDPDHCDFCKIQTKLPLGVPGVGLATRRFAGNIIRYLTDKRGNPRQQITADCIPWKLNDKKYDRLADIQSQYGDLRGRDLIVQCTQQTFQNMQIDPAQQCLWLTSGDLIKEQIVGVYKANRLDDEGLEQIIGRHVNADEAKRLIGLIQGSPVGVAMGGQTSMVSPADFQSLVDGSMSAPLPASPQGPGVQFVGGQPPQPQQSTLAQQLPPSQAQQFPPPPPPQQAKPSADSGPAPSMPRVAEFDSLLKL